MAQPEIKARHSIFRYRKFTILKDQTLGRGSYGAVYKARCDQLVCAAKVLHPTIVDPYDPGSGRILQRFQQECDFLDHIRHPHIVQYLGVCRDPESNLPVLLMELLDECLTKMLERSQHPISYHIQVDLCHDVSLAVAYLHSNGIIHRDLSGNNVLVIAGRIAKVTDFGMSKLVGSNRHMTPLTLCPGTHCYMSPESLKEPPRYTEKIDVFSEGVIMIQVCTRQFPDPGPAMKEIKDPRYPTGAIQIAVLESERRKNHIDLIDQTHPLLPIATKCLEYKEKDRPSAEELCQRLAALKESTEYTESMQYMTPATSKAIRTLQQEQDELARQVDREITAKDQAIQQMVAKDQEVEGLRTQLQELNEKLVGNEQVIAAKNLEIKRLKQQVESILTQLGEQNKILVDNEKVIAEFQKVSMPFKDLQIQKLDLRRQLKPESPSLKVKDFKRKEGGKALFGDWNEPFLPKGMEPPEEIDFKWKDGEKALFSSWRGSSSVVVGNVAYFTSDEYVHSYDSSTEKWDILRTCPQMFGSLAEIHGLLTMVGGKDRKRNVPSHLDIHPIAIQRYRGLSIVRNELVSLTETGKWVEEFPPMPTRRCYTTATTYQNHLIVAGGTSTIYNDNSMATVEVLNTDTLVWSTAPSLPHPFAFASATVCRDRLYILGGNERKGTCRSVFSCSLPELLRPRSLLGKLQSRAIWERDADIPVYDSTCATVCGQVVAVGGEDKHEKTTTAVYRYDPITQSWKVISHMTTARSTCHVAVLNTNILMVVGGYVSETKTTDSVEIAEF